MSVPPATTPSAAPAGRAAAQRAGTLPQQGAGTAAAQAAIPPARQVAGRFARRWLHHYAKGKLRADPLYPAIAALLRDRPGPVLDLGCGIGLLAFYLRAAGLDHPVRGLDQDEAKLAAAAAAVRPGEPICFERVDVTAGLPAFQGHVAVLDLLHYLPPPAQAPLLQAAAARVAPGHLLLMRTGLRDRSWRYRMSLACEWLGRASGWLGPLGRFPAWPELAATLQAAGLAAERRPLWGRTPFNNYLIIGRRPTI